MSGEDCLKILAELANDIETAAVNLKRQIGDVQGIKNNEFPDFSKLFWEKRNGAKGEYEQTSRAANNNSDLFQKLQQKVKEHKGFWKHQPFTFWFHQTDENIIDRRKV